MVEKINRISRYCLLFVSALLWVSAPVRSAQSRGISLISDTETQRYLANVVKPLFDSANVRFNRNAIFIVNDDSLNAFVSDGNYLFVHTGTLMNIDDTNELSGILAHETGHIKGGHIVRQKLNMQNMQYVMLGSMLAAGAAALSTGRGDAAMAVILGSQSSALNSMLNYRIEEERSADETAVKLLSKTKQSTNGLKRFMQKVKKQNALSGVEENAYFRTHPMTSERISHFNEASKTNKYSAKNDNDADLKMIKAKLISFLDEPKKVERMYPKSRTDDASRYAHAILAFRKADVNGALKNIDSLIEKHPENPYFYELKGQFLFESGRVAESVNVLEQAVEKSDGAPLIKLALAHAILENSPNVSQAQKAVQLLQQPLLEVPSSEVWRLLAKAYGVAGEKAQSHYATAQFNYTIGNIEGAKKQLKLALEAGADKATLLKIDDLNAQINEK